MDSFQIASILGTKFKNEVELPTGIPTQYDNHKFTPPSTKWMACNILFDSEDQVTCGSIGGRTFRQYGFLHVKIFTPIEEGDGDAIEIADTIRSKFRNASDGITYRRASISGPGERTPDGKWWQVNVVVWWQADQHGI